jgi:hypothetical protein
VGHDEDRIEWICHTCGLRFGLRQHGPQISTFHMGRCDICGKYAPLTEPRDFGNLKIGGANHGL